MYVDLSIHSMAVFPHMETNRLSTKPFLCPEPVPTLLSGVHGLPVGLLWTPWASYGRSRQLSQTELSMSCGSAIHSDEKWYQAKQPQHPSPSYLHGSAFWLCSCGNKDAISLWMGRCCWTPCLCQAALLCSRRSSAFVSTCLRNSLYIESRWGDDALRKLIILIIVFITSAYSSDRVEHRTDWWIMQW